MWEGSEGPLGAENKQERGGSPTTTSKCPQPPKLERGAEK